MWKFHEITSCCIKGQPVFYATNFQNFFEQFQKVAKACIIFPKLRNRAQKKSCPVVQDRQSFKAYFPSGLGPKQAILYQNHLLTQRSHLVPEHGSRVQYSLGTNVNTPFFQVPKLEFGNGASVRVRGSKVGTRSVCAHPFCQFCFALASKLMFQNGI